MNQLIKKLVLTCVGLLALVTSIAAQDNGFDFSKRVGVATVNDKKELCLAIPNSSLIAGSRLTLIITDGRQSAGEAIVVNPLVAACTENAGTEDGNSYYLLKVTKGGSKFIPSDRVFGPFIAIFEVPSPVKVFKGIVTSDFDGNRTREYYRQCTSGEGVHLTIWAGRPLRGKRLWNWYHYLGYDVVPNCKQADYKEN
ncbi:MAG: hypothetical protein ABIP75_06230 [Pyrinomonadaceae bacterium]